LARARSCKALLFGCLLAALWFASGSLQAQDKPSAAPAPAEAPSQLSQPIPQGELPPINQQTGQPSDAPKAKPPVAPKPFAPPPPPSEPTITWYQWLKFLVGFIVVFCVGFVIGRATAPRTPGTRPELERGSVPEGVETRAATVAKTPGAQVSFQRCYWDFSDIYNELWHAAEDERERDDGRIKSLALWRERLGAKEGTDGQALNRAWKQVETYRDTPARDKARIWLAALEKWGLTRVQPAQIDVDERTLRQFTITPRDARRAVVTEPCWLYAGQLVLKGRASADPSRA
jgi:hypothetical protein